jgi:LPS-assembly lipoprotein
LSGCGWRPVYAPVSSGGTGPAEQGLMETEVGWLPERNGQLLREALKARFERGTGGAARRYDLSVNLSIQAEAIAIQRDNTTSRVRLIGTAAWSLQAQDPQRSTLATGFAREVDGYNIFNQQYFAADLQSTTVQRRMTDALAEQITLQVAAWFNRRAAAG